MARRAGRRVRVLRIEYADGRVSDVVTDDRWRIDDGPTVFDDLYGGEMYDARLTRPGYDTGRLRRRRLGARERGRRPARDAGQPAPAADPRHRVAAGGRDHRAGRRHLRRQVPARARRLGADRRRRPGRDHDPRAVRREAEGRRAAGLLQQRRLPGRLPDRPASSSPAPARRRSWESRFSYKGFQYVQVTGWPGDEPAAAERVHREGGAHRRGARPARSRARARS